MTTFGDLDSAAQASLAAVMESGEPPDPAGLSRCLQSVLRLVRTGQARTSSTRRPDIAQPLAEDVSRVLGVLAAGVDAAPGRLNRTADLLGASGDLLATHGLLTLNGPVDRSDLAAVLDSADARAQILRTAGRWAAALAALATQHAAATSAPTLRDAARTLAETAEAVVWATRHAGADFVGAAPALGPLSRDEPAPHESPAELVGRAASGAERMHLLAFRATQRGQWVHHPPETLARSALAMAASQHTVGRLLRHLAGEQNARPHGDLCRAAALADVSYEAWAVVQERWHGIRAPAPGRPPRPTDIEAGDLVTRIGRLAYPDPEWTPTLGASSTLRAAAEIAPDHARLNQLLTGLHRVTICASLLAVDHANVTRAMSRSQALLVPTRTLPPSDEVRQAWSPAAPRSTVALLTSYDIARHTCLDAAESLAGLLHDADPALAAQVELGRRRATQGWQSASRPEPALGQTLDEPARSISIEP